MEAFTLYSTAAPVSASKPRPVRAKYDAAQTTRENQRHWANADFLSAVASMSPAVRRTLRARARYEEQNDGYAAGLIKDLAADVVGSGPSIEVRLDRDQDNRVIEEAWFEWCDAVNFYDRLRILEESRSRDGECYGLFETNLDLLDRTPITLDVILFEADQVGDPPGRNRPWDPQADDGITTNALGYPETYTILQRHPGDNRGVSGLTDGKMVPAKQVLHWFRACRPGQLRGITDLTTALPILPLLRRYSQATVGAAEVAARFAVLLESSLPPPDGDEDTPQDFDPFDLPQLGGMTLPAGFKATQLKPEHPHTGFHTFDDAMLRRAGRGTQMPFGGIVGDHSKYNYSSARLELWFRNRRRNIVRDQLRIRVLDPILRAWWTEAKLAGVVPKTDRLTLPHAWQYESDPSLDPMKDASAWDMGLRNGTATLDEVWSAKGQDWRDRLRKMSEIATECDRLGLTGVAEIIRGKVPAGQPVPVPLNESTAGVSP